MPRNYYLVLGVGREADLDQIKKAYRQIAKKYHPDITRSESNERFRELQEAYETLADIDKRKQYDSRLKKVEMPLRPAVRRTTAVEDVSAGQRFGRFESLIDEFFEGFLPGSFQAGKIGAARKDLYFEIILSPTEALHGGLFPIQFPVIEHCSACSGYGQRGSLVCRFCDGNGVIQSEREFSLSIPPRTTHGTRVTLSMEDIGLRGVDLHLLISVDPSMEDQ